jgi:hypothetical protein
MTPHVPFSVPSPPRSVMSGRSEARLGLAERLADEHQPHRRAVADRRLRDGYGHGDDPYFSSRKALTSSTRRREIGAFDGFDVRIHRRGGGGLEAETPEVHSSRASTTERLGAGTLAMGQPDHRTLRPRRI